MMCHVEVYRGGIWIKTLSNRSFRIIFPLFMRRVKEGQQVKLIINGAKQ